METKRIICLANSRKRGEHCVAGIEVLDGGQLGGWIRPVGSGWEHALRTIEQSYADNTSPQVLDLLDVHLIEHRPDGCQVENWLVDGTRRWVKRGEVERQRLIGAMQPPATLFLNAGSTSAGFNDQIPTAQADVTGCSLLLVHVPQVELRVFAHYGRTKCQARFDYNGVHYWIGVTDPVIEAEFQPHGPATYDLGACLLSVSLSAPLVKEVDNISYRFKLIAAIIRLP
ncbi:dual OB domain-containing protein [Burkholderia glumae]|uniref:dual OB domain-containing protein n=1 Tax=Burkholderia glumae TaxID=337 RepID=UPI0012F839F0